MRAVPGAGRDRRGSRLEPKASLACSPSPHDVFSGLRMGPVRPSQFREYRQPSRSERSIVSAYFEKRSVQSSRSNAGGITFAVKHRSMRVAAHETDDHAE